MAAWEAATAVLEWVRDHLELIEDDQRPQDARSVLRRGGGRCSGLANATAALLMTAGFEARTVSGLLVTDRRTIPHRWVEVYLPAAGWVPTDPTLGLWVITARHVVFAAAVGRMPEVEILSAFEEELRGLPRIRSTMIRPNEGAKLVCRLSDATDGREAIAVLERGADRRRALLGSEVRFDGLLPGRWMLVISIDGRVVERRELKLRGGEVHSYVVRLPVVADREVGS
jgi:hypothetical protein